MPIFKSSEAEIYYEVHGSGPPLLMVAGMASDSKSWQFILNEVSSHFRLIIFDNRGCGRTKTAVRSFGLNELAGDAYALLDYLDYDKVDLLGHSMGGMIAQEMALMHPERIGKLVLASSSPHLSEKATGILDKLYQKWVDGLDMAEWFRIMFQWLFTKEALENKKFMDAAIIFALAYPYPQTLEGFRGQVEALRGFDARDRISGIPHRCLIVSGEEDILITPEESRTLESISGETCFRLIPGAAHSIHAEQPEKFTQEVIPFLKS